MTSLVPCPTCTRHVRVSETRCPFCAAALPDDLRASAPRALPATRLSRAGTYAFGTGKLGTVALAAGATLATAALSACSAPAPHYGAPPRDLGVETDFGAPLYGSPPDLGTDGAASEPDLGSDAGLMGAYGSPPPADAGPQDSGGGAALYGNAPP